MITLKTGEVKLRLENRGRGPYKKEPVMRRKVPLTKVKCRPPFVAPPGKKWIFTPYVWNVKANRFLFASDYGRQCWCILVNAA